MTFLLAIAVQSSLVLLFGLAATWLLRHRSAAVRHALLATTLVCAAATPLAELVIPDRYAAMTMPATFEQRVVPTSMTVPVPSSPDTAPAAPAGRAPFVDSTVSPLQAAFTVWAGGAIISLLGLCVGLVRLWRLSRRARPANAGAWVESVARASRADTTAGRIAVRIFDRPSTVLVWGMRRPILLVPANAETWPQDRIDAVVQHELAHIRRGDWVMQLLAELIRAAYWCNPLVWLTCARLRAESEAASDDAVIAGGADGTAYAGHIVAIARELRAPTWIPAPAIVRRSTLERRIAAMLDPSRDRRSLTARTRGATAALTLGATITVAALTAQSFVSLTGTIVDPSQGVLPGVTLVLTNDASGAKYEIKTDRTGHYEFVGLPPGSYTLNAALPGFARFSGRVTVGAQNIQQDLILSLGTLQESITVTDGPPAAPPSPAQLREIEERRLRVEEIRRKRAAAPCAAVQPGGDAPIGGNIRVPVKLLDVRPRYPESLQGTGGIVVLNTQIGLDGRVNDIEVVSATHPAFADSAIDAVRQWEFDATLLNCERVVTPMTVTINFKTAQ